MKLLFQSKASAPPRSPEPLAMDESEKVNNEVRSVEDVSTDAVVITSEAPQDNEGEKKGDVAVSDETQLSEKPPSSPTAIPDNSLVGKMDTKAALSFATKLEDLDTIESMHVIAGAGTNCLTVADPVPEKDLDVKSLPTLEDAPYVSNNLIVPSMSNSNLSVPSNVGYSILEQPEQELLRNLNDPLTHEPHDTTEDNPEAPSIDPAVKKSNEAALSQLTTSYHTHSAEAFMNVGNLLLESHETASKLSPDDNNGDPSTNEQIPTETANQKWWKQIFTGKVARAKSILPKLHRNVSDAEKKSPEKENDSNSKSSTNVKDECDSNGADQDEVDPLVSGFQANNPNQAHQPARKNVSWGFLWFLLLVLFLAPLFIVHDNINMNEAAIFEKEATLTTSNYTAGILSLSSLLEFESESTYSMPEEDHTEISETSDSFFFFGVVLSLLCFLAVVALPSKILTHLVTGRKSFLKKKKKGTYQKLPCDINLSKYQKLRIVDLKPLLKARNCKVSGRKDILIQRLVSAYEKELWDQTVKSLRASLKKKSLKQAGRKHELVARLVEAGI